MSVLGSIREQEVLYLVLTLKLLGFDSELEVKILFQKVNSLEIDSIDL